MLEPVTVAANCCVPLVRIEAEVGEIVTRTTGAVVTVTVAEADLVVSATLVAVTVTLPVVLGAVKRPLAETLPPLADQVTAVLLEPVTVAANCWVALVTTEATVGEIATATTGTLTVMVADADLVFSATLVAVTAKVPALLGAA